MAEAVVFAMLASYVLSRTLVPTMALLLMGHAHDAPGGNFVTRGIRSVNASFNRRFDKMRDAYTLLLSHLLIHRLSFMGIFLVPCLASCGLYMMLGRDLFPTVDTGQIKLHMRAPTGTRIENTAVLADHVEEVVRQIIPTAELETIVDNLGLPYSGINLAYSNSGTIGTLDADIMISLKHGHRPSEEYMAKLTPALRARFPGVEFFYQPADIVTQILNFGISSAIDVQVYGSNMRPNHQLAAKLAERIQKVPGATDVHIHQRLDTPSIRLTMDRARLQGMGLSPTDVAQNLLVPLSGSFQTSPNFWLNPNTSIVYNVMVQMPQYTVSSLDDLLRLPVKTNSNSPGAAAAAAANQPQQMMGNLVSASPSSEYGLVSRYNILPSIDVYANVSGRDLGSVADEVQKIVDDAKAEYPKGTRVTLRGQVQTMKSSYVGLGVGILGAIVLVYLLIVINFQSWMDPFIIITALPAALAGIAWMLLLTGTHLSVTALTGAIMTMGVATANSILVVSFARQRLDTGLPPLSAALEAGATRLRPVLMTALAMILGMIPMAIGIGEGAEQNAPLGRAVIGGLLFATVSTLLFVPVVFATMHKFLAERKARRAGHAAAHPPSPSAPDSTQEVPT
jgi:multidrug efflux pump subunit AcrB